MNLRHPRHLRLKNQTDKLSFNNNKMKTYLYPLLAGLICLAGCTNEDAPMEQPEETAATFRIDTRGEIGPDRLARLYIGERKPEHFTEDPTHLHVNRIVDFSEGSVTVEELKPQWYKFAFVSVPKINDTGTDIFTETTPGKGSCDLNDQMIDYKPVFLHTGSYMEDPENEDNNVTLHATPDGDIFRKVINRWTESGKMVSETVAMNRLNGQLVIDMGVLEDQFDCDGFAKGEVTVTVTVNDLPTRLYITDNDVDEIKTADIYKSMSWQTKPQPNEIITDEEGDKVDVGKKHHVIYINLLPGTLSGSVTVTTPEGEFTYPLQGAMGQPVIKPNTRTRLTFNGVSDGMFQVQYAGYKNTQIDVDDDAWDGWEEQTII